jgi:hypothetical protein
MGLNRAPTVILDFSRLTNRCVHSAWSKNGATVLSVVTGGNEPVKG